MVYGKKPGKIPRSKSSVGSSSVPLPSAKDQSASKLVSAPVEVKVFPIPFDQYWTNLSDAELLGSQPVL
jgi:hypothetical protein